MAIGSILYRKKNYEAAFNYYQLIDTAYHMSANAKSVIYNNMAGCYNYIENYEMAEHYYKKSIAVLPDTTRLAIAYLNIGSLYFDYYKNKDAAYYWHKSLHLAKAQKNNHILENVYFNFSLLNEMEGDYRQAFSNYKKADSLGALLDNKEKIWQLSQIEKKLALQSKQLQIAELEKLNSKKEMELSKRSMQRNVLIAAALGLLLIAGIVTIFLVQKNKAAKIIYSQRNELENLNKTKDRLFSIIAHDLRSPVHSLQQKNVQAMKSMESGDHVTAKEMIRHIRKDTEQTSLLLNNLLHWSFTETGNLFLLPQPLLLRACIEQVTEELSFASREKNLRFELCIPGQLIVTTDLNSLKIILRNLLQNAVKFSYPDQLIQINCKEEAAGVSIRIRDYGIGIPLELHRSLFSMDHNKIRKGTQDEHGSGLGLWLIHYLLQKNKGHISVNALTEPGTEITVTLKHNVS